MNSYELNAKNMCDDFYNLFESLLENQSLYSKKNNPYLLGKLFIFKNKFLKIFRDQIFTKIKLFLQKISKVVR